MPRPPLLGTPNTPQFRQVEPPRVTEELVAASPTPPPRPRTCVRARYGDRRRRAWPERYAHGRCRHDGSDLRLDARGLAACHHGLRRRADRFGVCTVAGLGDDHGAERLVADQAGQQHARRRVAEPGPLLPGRNLLRARRVRLVGRLTSFCSRGDPGLQGNRHDLACGLPQRRFHASGHLILRPSVKTTAKSDLVVGFFATNSTKTLRAPSSMTQIFDARWASKGWSLDGEGDGYVQTAAGPTGIKTATIWGRSSSGIGQLLALRNRRFGGASASAASAAAPASTASAPPHRLRLHRLRRHRLLPRHRLLHRLHLPPPPPPPPGGVLPVPCGADINAFTRGASCRHGGEPGAALPVTRTSPRPRRQRCSARA